MRSVRDLMTPLVTTLHPWDAVEKATREMELSAIGHLPLVDREGLLVGLVSEHDLWRAPAATALLSKIMATDVLTVGEDTPLTEAAYLLLRRRIGCLPVVDAGGRLVGIVTTTDFVRLAYELLGGVDLEDRAREEHESEKL